MDINFQHLIPGNFNENSHVWVYQSDRAFNIEEALQIREILQKFTKDWKNNGVPVKGYAGLFFEHFIILMVDESAGGVGGFSTDNSIRMIKNIEKDFQVELMDRLMLAFLINERIHLLPLSILNPSIEKDFITQDTLYFNNTILTKKELLNNWIIPVKDSWLSMRVLEKDGAEVEL